ncbi:MAG: hypothetical protein DA405_00310 [Bacteroidetes bacterium]|nr:MAG: hypothetical protein DA405_00310 [Bacteroidota bacterium]
MVFFDLSKNFNKAFSFALYSSFPAVYSLLLFSSQPLNEKIHFFTCFGRIFNAVVSSRKVFFLARRWN